MKRKYSRICAVLSLLISFAVICPYTAYAAPQRRIETVVTMQTGSPRMSVNGVSVDIDGGGTAPVISDGRTLMPIRAFAECIGANVTWNSSLRTVLIACGGKKMQLTIDSDTAYVDYEAKKLDVPATIINDRTFLPIRFVAEGFGCEVDWNGETNTITIELHKENAQHAAVVYDLGSADVYKASEIVADLLGADLYSADDTDFTVKSYDTVLIGYSSGDLTDDMSEFLAGKDFTGKHIAPFCVGDIGGSEREISLKAAGAYVEDGLEFDKNALENGRVILSAAAWLSHLGLIQR